MHEHLIQADARGNGCGNGNLMAIAGKGHLDIAGARLPVNAVRSCGQIICADAHSARKTY